MENTNAPAPDVQDIAKGKTNAILAYCTPIGWIISIIMHSSAKSKFAAFHIRQGLGLWIIAIGIGILTMMLYMLLGYRMWFLITGFRAIVNLGILALAIMGLMNANNGKQVGIPVLGETFNKMFSGIN